MGDPGEHWILILFNFEHHITDIAIDFHNSVSSTNRYYNVAVSDNIIVNRSTL